MKLRKKIIGYITITALLAVGLMSGILYTGRTKMQQDIAGKVLRFHVLANSDSEADQNLKLKVRDAIGGYMQQKLQEAKSLKESEQITKDNLEQIVETAQNVMKQEGYAYEVNATIQMSEFPVKTYGSYTFPAGEYEALEVVIGAGAGHNWWCVMYPNMCFENSIYEVVDEEAAQALRKVLDEKEYEAVLSSGNYEVQFKYLTFLNGLCEKLQE